MGVLKVWDGSTWQSVSYTLDTGDAFVGPSAPAGTPVSGDLWWDTDETAPGITTPLTVVNGGTGATSPATARSSLGVGAAGNSTTTAGAPTAGTFARGDTWLDSANVLWVCTTAGTPGVWVAVSYNGAHVDFVPSFNLGITAIGNAIYVAKYKRLTDKTVWFSMRFGCGSTTTFTSAQVQMNLPFGTSVPTSNVALPCGSAQLNLVGGIFVGTTRVDSNGGITIISPSSASASGGALVGSSLNTSSALFLSGIYEII